MFSADIIFNPKYKVVDSYSLTPLALRLIQRIPTKYVDNLHNLLTLFPRLLYITPVDTTLVSITVFNYTLSHGMQNELVRIGKFIIKQTSYNNDDTFMILAQKYIEMLSVQVQLESSKLDESKIADINDDPSTTRVVLKLHHELFPLLVSHEDQLFLLYETNAPKVPINFFIGICGRLMTKPRQKEERTMRIFLKHFDYQQPPYTRENSWIKRSLESYEYKKEEMPSFDDMTREQVIKTISKSVPIDFNIKSEERKVLSVMKSIKKNKTFAGAYKRLVALSEDLNFDNFWLQLAKHKQGVSFTAKGSEKAKALAIIIGQDNSPPSDEDNDYMYIMKLRKMSCKKSYSLSLKRESTTLESMFLKIHFVLPDQTLLNLIESSFAVSTKIAVLTYMQFYVQSCKQLSIFDDKAALSIFNFDPSHPFMFNAVFLCVASIATMKIDVPGASDIINDFLVTTFKTCELSAYHQIQEHQ